MAYHEELITGRTDATGNATIQLGPVSQYEDVWFLGYVIAECVDGSSANYRLFNPLSGAKLGGFAGQMAVVGPMLLKPQQNLSLLVNAGPPNTPITGALVGDVHADPNQLALRPIPTAAGANVGLPSFPSITVTGSADVQGLATFEGNVEFKGPDPWIDPLNPAYGAKGDGVTLDTAAIQLAANAAGGGKKLRFAPGFAFYTGGFTISSGTVVEANGATIKLANGGQSTLLLFQDQPHTDTQIQGGIWDGNGGGQAGAGSAAVIHGGSGINTSHNRTRISDVVVLNAGQHGLFLSTQDHATNPKWITRCVVSDHGIKAIGYGIYIDYCPATFIEGCWVNAVSNTNDNFELGHLGQSTMLGCISIGGQIQFPFADDTRIIGCLQINNTIQNDGNTANRVVLLGCTVLNAAPAAGFGGINVAGAGTVIQGCRVQVTGSVAGTCGIGANAQTMSDATITGCVAETLAAAVSGNAYSLGGTGGSTGNVVSSCVAFGKWTIGVDIIGPNNTASFNTLDLSAAVATYGIKLEHSDATGVLANNCSLIGNRILGAPTNPIDHNGVAGNITGTICRDNQGHNPHSAITTPAISNALITNRTGGDVAVYVTTGGANNVPQVNLNGINTTQVVPINSAGVFIGLVHAVGSIQLVGANVAGSSWVWVPVS